MNANVGNDVQRRSAKLGVVLDDKRGVVQVTTEDCTSFYAPGLEYRVSADPSAPVFYEGDVRYKTSAPTDSSSMAFVVNVPVGDPPFTEVIARSHALGRDVARARVRLVPGALTCVWLVPDDAL